MSGHWADEYVGLPFKEKGRDRAGLDCWGLVRLVLEEVADVNLPLWREGDGHVVFHNQAKSFEDIRIEDAQPMDCLIMLEDVRSGLSWISAAVHIGIVVAPQRALHIRRGMLSCVEPFSALRIFGAKKGPWHAR